MQALLAEAGVRGGRLLSSDRQMQRRVRMFVTAAVPYLVDAQRQAAESALPAIGALLCRCAPRLATG